MHAIVAEENVEEQTRHVLSEIFSGSSLDKENLREHYVLTLRHWLGRLETHHAEALSFVDEAIYRVWRLYLAGSGHGFRRGHIAVYQTLLAKLDSSGQTKLPSTREDWYT